MSIEEIRKGAPDETATHYSEACEVIYLRRHKGVWNCWVFDGWFLYALEDDEDIKTLHGE